MSDVASACVPCAVGHFSTSAGVLNEAFRFRNEGLTSPQILDRIAKAIEEQNALERVDLTPEKMQKLQDWERSLAEEALTKSRELRHSLESLQSIEELESLAADTEEFYKKLNREWTTKRLLECPTCQIKLEEPKPKKLKVEYGSEAAEKRRKLLEEIRSETETG